MKSTKTLLKLVSLALGAFLFATTAVAAQPGKKLSASEAANQMVLEAMWTAGGQEYRDTVVILANDYKEKMDKQCRVKNFNVAVAAAMFRVHTPAGAESARNKLILRQVATMACEMSPYISEKNKAVAVQKIWKM